jgi:hypothetical protein
MADKSLKMEGKLPQGDGNGFADPQVIKAMMDGPEALHIGIVLFKVGKIETDTDTGDQVGKARVARVEIVVDNSDGDVTALTKTLRRIYEKRTGATTLDAELEDAIEAALSHVKVQDDDQV